MIILNEGLLFHTLYFLFLSFLVLMRFTGWLPLFLFSDGSLRESTLAAVSLFQCQLPIMNQLRICASATYVTILVVTGNFNCQCHDTILLRYSCCCHWKFQLSVSRYKIVRIESPFSLVLISHVGPCVNISTVLVIIF